MECESAFKEGSMMHPTGESREQREELTKRAVADVLRMRMAARRIRQSDLARWSGMSRSYVQKLLRGGSCPTLFVLAELAHALRMEDEHALWREVLKRRDALRER